MDDNSCYENSCYNDLWIDGNNIPALLQYLEGEEYGQDLLIDFNKIIPMPEELNVLGVWGVPKHRVIAIAENDFRELDNDHWAKQNNITTIEELCAFLKTKEGGKRDIEELRRLGNIYLSNLSKYGFSDGCSWRKENWGTRSNVENPAFIHDTSRNLGIRFETFDGPPIKVVTALARQFPNNVFTFRYYERDAGFEGCVKVKGEQIMEESYLEHCRWWRENHVVVVGRKPIEDELSIWYYRVDGKSSRPQQMEKD